MEIYLVRHGLSEANEKMIFQGQIDYHLSGEGKRQAEFLGRYFVFKEIKFDRAVTSHLSRAKETAQIILGCQDNPPAIEIENNFQEIDIGSLQGLNREEVKVKFPEYYKRGPDQWLDFSEYGGESWADICKRIDDSMPRYAPYKDLLTDKKLLIVAHGGILRAMIRHLIAADYNFMSLRVENCCHIKINFLTIREHLRRYIEYIMPLEELNMDGESYHHEISDEHRANLVS